MGIAMNKTAVKVGKAEEGRNISLASRNRPLRNSRKFGRIHLDAVSTNDVAKVLNFGFIKFAFLGVSEKIGITKSIQDELDMTIMLILVFRENKNIIKVNDAKDVKVITKGILDKSLKGSRSIGETKRHNKVFIKSQRGSKGSLPFISFLNANKVEGVLQINNRKDRTALGAVKEIVNERKRISVLLCDGIQATIINTKTKFTSLATSEENRRSSRRSRTTNEALFEVLINIIEKSFTLIE